MQFGPQGTGKLPPLIRDDGGRNAKTGNPTSQEGSGAGQGGNVREWEGLNPAGEAVYDG